MSTYITAIVAGEYHRVDDVYEGPHGTIPLGHLCRQSMVPHLDVDELLEVTKQGFAFFEDAFGYPYPFGKYDQAYVPEYNMGAMENAGCVTLRDEYLPRSRQTHAFYEQRANTVLHEMAHMWFGDLVTMKWWDDLWLNESFAEWAAHHSSVKATKYTEAWTGFTNARKNWAYRQDQLPSTHPVVADNHDLEAVEVNFDGITYAKGASILKQLVAYVGEEEFLSGLRDYFDKHAFGNTEYGDLVTALEAVSGRDLASWSQEWLETSGVNTLTPAFEVDGVRGVHVLRASSRATTPTSRPCARTASASASTRPRAVAWCAATTSRPTSRAPRPRSPRWSVSSSRRCCCSTTATCPTPRSASTTARWRPWSPRSTPSTTPWPARCAGARRGT